ncbi:MAG: PE-PGRS family protein, partial [Bacteroidetes bacterium]|nr:PE-PGRS family protein [Bacteroidota bacterium]
ATVMSPVVQLYLDKATGGDISPDGTEILMRTNELIWYWKLPAGTSITQGLLSQPEVAPYANNEPQGEGIGFAADGSGYYTDTEIKGYPGKLATLSFYKRK